MTSTFSLWESFQAIMARPATSNLRFYMSVATLPDMPSAATAEPMPPDGHKAHKNQLTVIPQAFRRLETMHIMAKGFSQEALDFLDRRIPSAPLDADNLDEYTGEALTLPCAPHYNIPRHVGGQVSNIERVCRWVVEYPLTTSQRILHLTMPQTDDWSFSPEKHARDIDMDKDIFRYTTFSAAAAPLPPRGCAIPSVTVVIQPPWILSPQDLVAFVACGALPPYNPNGPVKDYTCSQRLWSKIWDVCFRERSRWFVVTSYSGWVFGAFSKGWTRAFVSPIFKSDDQDPTVEEILVFWLASAVGVDGGWTIPEVPEPVHTIGLEVANSIPPPLTRRPPFAPSISDWSGEGGAHMSDTSSTIHAEEVDSRLMDLQDEGHCGSLSGVPNNPIVREKYRHDSIDSVEGIQHWINHVDPTSVPPERTPSPSPSQSSASTVREYTWNSSREGDWVSVDVRDRRYDYVCSG